MIGSLVLCCLVAAVGILLISDANVLLYLSAPLPPRAFDRQVVWVVGASSGIGAGLSEEFCKNGATVVLSARRVDMLEQLRNKCLSQGASAALVLPLDVMQHDQHEIAFKRVLDSFDHLDMIVLNAGVDQANLAIETDFSTTEYLINLNFMSYVSLTKAVLPHMVARKSGKIVVTSSLAGIMGTPLSSSYSATKFALQGYYSALRAEVAVDKVDVFIVNPGPVQSEIFSKTLQGSTKASLADDTMSTERCVQLIAKGIHHGIYDMWISRHPYLLLTYITQYMPKLSRELFKNLFGPVRVYAFRNGRGIFDITVIPEFIKLKFSGGLDR